MAGPARARKIRVNAPLDQLILTIGTRLALRLVEARGGVRVYIPSQERLTSDCPLAQIIGVEAAAKLAALGKAWGDQWVTIPLARAYVRRQRDREIRARYRTETAAALALEYDLSERQVYAIAAYGVEEDAIGGASESSSQLGLF